MIRFMYQGGFKSESDVRESRCGKWCCSFHAFPSALASSLALLLWLLQKTQVWVFLSDFGEQEIYEWLYEWKRNKKRLVPFPWDPYLQLRPVCVGLRRVSHIQATDRSMVQRDCILHNQQDPEPGNAWKQILETHWEQICIFSWGTTTHPLRGPTPVQNTSILASA